METATTAGYADNSPSNPSAQYQYISPSPQHDQAPTQPAPEARALTLDDFYLCDDIGQGSSARVVSCKFKVPLSDGSFALTASSYALKVIFRNDHMKYYIFNEVAIHSAIQSAQRIRPPNILPIHGYFSDLNRVYLCTELLPYGSLQDLISFYYSTSFDFNEHKFAPFATVPTPKGDQYPDHLTSTPTTHKTLKPQPLPLMEHSLSLQASHSQRLRISIQAQQPATPSKAQLVIASAVHQQSPQPSTPKKLSSLFNTPNLCSPPSTPGASQTPAQTENYDYPVNVDALPKELRPLREGTTKIPHHLIAYYITSITCAVLYLNHLGIAHRDLKPDNLLFGSTLINTTPILHPPHLIPNTTTSTTPSSVPDQDLLSNHYRPSLPQIHTQRSTSDNHTPRLYPLLKVVDFGAAGVISEPVVPSATSQTHDYKNPNRQKRRTSFVGTAEYSSPEVIQGQPHGFEVDYWAVGCIFYQLLTGRPPFVSEEILRQRAYMGGDFTPQDKVDIQCYYQTRLGLLRGHDSCAPIYTPSLSQRSRKGKLFRNIPPFQQPVLSKQSSSKHAPRQLSKTSHLPQTSSGKDHRLYPDCSSMMSSPLSQRRSFVGFPDPESNPHFPPSHHKQGRKMPTTNSNNNVPKLKIDPEDSQHNSHAAYPNFSRLSSEESSNYPPQSPHHQPYEQFGNTAIDHQHHPYHDHRLSSPQPFRSNPTTDLIDHQDQPDPHNQHLQHLQQYEFEDTDDHDFQASRPRGGAIDFSQFAPISSRPHLNGQQPVSTGDSFPQQMGSREPSFHHPQQHPAQPISPSRHNRQDFQPNTPYINRQRSIPQPSLHTPAPTNNNSLRFSNHNQTPFNMTNHHPMPYLPSDHSTPKPSIYNHDDFTQHTQEDQERTNQVLACQYRLIAECSYSIPSDIDEDAKDLICKFLIHRYEDRITPIDVFKHPYMRKYMDSQSQTLFIYVLTHLLPSLQSSTATPQ